MRLPRLVTSALAAVLGVARADADVMADAATIAEQGRALQEGFKDQDMPSWLSGKAGAEASREAVEEIYARSRQLVAQVLSQPASLEPLDTRRRIEVFVSLSLGDAALQEILKEASGRRDVVAVFRGVPEGASFTAGVRRIQGLASGIDPAPAVLIDPTRFRALGISDVPAIALLSDSGAVATASGITGIEAFLARVKSGKRGDMGRLGPVRAIAEPDLIAVMQQRLAELDLTSRKAAAMKRYFEKVDFLTLPTAEEPRRRTVDPTVLVTQDITDADGRVLLPAGHRINPLKHYPFSARLIVFDANDRAQRDLAQRVMRGANTKAILLTTRLDRGAGWEGLKRIEDEMRAPIYLLTAEVRERFQIERTVSVVTAKENAFEVLEMPATASEEDK